MAAAGNPSAHPESFTSCGAFVNGTAVCEGYAKAMKLLLDSQGIESLYVTGTATTSGGTGGHAWNIVQIGNVWYDLDSTFDDPVYVTHSGYDTSNKVPSYTYFNITSFPLYNGQPDHTQGVFNSSDPFDSENYAVMPAIS
jgi:transglutaminase/protease-like cytokinesis protein 3